MVRLHVLIVHRYGPVYPSVSNSATGGAPATQSAATVTRIEPTVLNQPVDLLLPDFAAVCLWQSKYQRYHAIRDHKVTKKQTNKYTRNNFVGGGLGVGQDTGRHTAERRACSIFPTLKTHKTHY